MKFLIRLFGSTLAVIIAAYLIPAVSVASFKVALVVAVVMGILNLFIKPLLVFLTLPINIMTLGLFTFLINALLVLVAAYFVTGFEVATFIGAILFSVVMSIVSSFFHTLSK